MTRSAPPTKEEIRQYAFERGADLCGFVSTARLNTVTPTRYKPSRLWPAAKTAISIGKRFLTGAAKVGITDSIQNGHWISWRTCDLLNTLALDIGHFLERGGQVALPLSSGNMADPDHTNRGVFAELSHRHTAAQAGLGVIGVPTFLVTPQFGPRVYLNTILTETEYEPDPRLDFDPCGTDCDACIKACPHEAIVRGRRTIKKPLCIPHAMPHGARPMRDFILGVMSKTDPKEREAALYDAQFLRLFRATVFGVGTFAGCFFCLEACPIGKDGPAMATPAAGTKQL